MQELQLQLPYPQFTGVTTDVQMIANSTYHALQLSAEKRYSNGLQLLANFTWSKSIDDSSVADDNVTWLGSFTSLQDPNKPWLERSLSTFDIPWIVQFSYVTNCLSGVVKHSWEHAARTRCDRGRMENQWSLAHAGRTAAATDHRRWNAAAYLWDLRVHCAA